MWPYFFIAVLDDHYLAVFAVPPQDTTAEVVLRTMTPLVDDHMAVVRVTSLATVLPFYKRTKDEVLLVLDDNCSTSGKVSTLLGAPLSFGRRRAGHLRPR